MKKEYFYAGVSIFFWSTIATVTKLMLENLDSMQINMVSSLFAFVFLLIVSLVKGKLRELKNYHIIDYVKIFLLGVLGTFFYNLFLYLGIDAMDASQAFIINYLWPIMTVVFACIILKEKMTVRKAVAIALSFAGVIIVTANGSLLNIEKNTAKGAVYCVLAAVSYGLFSVLNKRTTYDKTLTMMFFYFSAFVISLAYIVLTGSSFIMTEFQMGGMLWMGIFTAAIAYTSWALALDYGDTAKVSNLAYITPFLSLVWTGIILKEEFKAFSLIGLVVIIIGVFIQLKEKK
ncbi:MAG: DMT family transporter [Clostridia bacterium]|nr:DMT family transporter [Clostridia bacterium]